jgi:DNA-directed RNA polymerase omega subunit
MLAFDLDNCLRYISNKYELVLLSKVRAMEMFSGDFEPLIKKYHCEKDFFTALREIADGLHSYEVLNEKFMLGIKNEIVGVLVNNDEAFSKGKDSFTEDSLFARIFEDMRSSSDGAPISQDNIDALIDKAIQSSEKNIRHDEEIDGFLNIKRDEETDGFVSINPDIYSDEDDN